MTGGGMVAVRALLVGGLLAALPVTASSQVGDVNCDEVVSIADVVNVLRLALDLPTEGLCEGVTISAEPGAPTMYGLEPVETADGDLVLRFVPFVVPPHEHAHEHDPIAPLPHDHPPKPPAAHTHDLQPHEHDPTDHDHGVTGGPWATVEHEHGPDMPQAPARLGEGFVIVGAVGSYAPPLAGIQVRVRLPDWIIPGTVKLNGAGPFEHGNIYAAPEEAGVFDFGAAIPPQDQPFELPAYGFMELWFQYHEQPDPDVSWFDTLDCQGATVDGTIVPWGVNDPSGVLAYWNRGLRLFPDPAPP